MENKLPHQHIKYATLAFIYFESFHKDKTYYSNPRKSIPVLSIYCLLLQQTMTTTVTLHYIHCIRRRKKSIGIGKQVGTYLKHIPVLILKYSNLYIKAPQFKHIQISFVYVTIFSHMSQVYVCTYVCMCLCVFVSFVLKANIY